MSKKPLNTLTKCCVCKKSVYEIPRYVEEAKDYYECDIPNMQEFAESDGTYDKETNTVVCTECYIALGAPSNLELKKYRK